MAILPLDIIFSKSAMELRRTLPWEVANISSMPLESISSGHGMMVVMASSSANGSKFTMALPLPVGLAAGRR